MAASRPGQAAAATCGWTLRALRRLRSAAVAAAMSAVQPHVSLADVLEEERHCCQATCDEWQLQGMKRGPGAPSQSRCNHRQHAHDKRPCTAGAGTDSRGRSPDVATASALAGGPSPYLAILAATEGIQADEDRRRAGGAAPDAHPGSAAAHPAALPDGGNPLAAAPGGSATKHASSSPPEGSSRAPTGVACRPVVRRTTKRMPPPRPADLKCVRTRAHRSCACCGGGLSRVSLPAGQQAGHAWRIQ